MKQKTYWAWKTVPEIYRFWSDFTNIYFGGYSQREDNIASLWVNVISKSTIKAQESD